MDHRDALRRDEPAPTPAPAPVVAAPEMTPLAGPGSLPAMAGAGASMRAAWAHGIQRGAGNQALARALHAGAGGVVARVPAPMGTVTQPNGATQPIQGSVVTPGRPDHETEREMQIARGLSAMMDHARIRMLESRNQLTSATESFRDYASAQIDGMDGDPSDYWGLINVASGLIGGVVGIAFPPAALAMAIAVAVQGAIQTAVTAETKGARGDAKEQAKSAMRSFATGTRDGFDRGSEQARSQQGPIYQRAWMLSLSDEEARVKFESGQQQDLDALCDQVGVTTNDLFAPTLRQLNGAFGEWMGQQRFNQDHTRFWEMIAEADPSSEVGRERTRMRGEGRSAGETAADAAIRARQGR